MPALSGCFIAPEIISEEEHHSRAQNDQDALFSGQDIPTDPISLPEAIARTVKHNLDYRLASMETAFSMQQLDAAKLQMLPRLAINAGYSMRSNESASRSLSYERRVQSLEPSVSSDRDRITADIGFSWSILDFGISYFQAKQQANRYLIMMERRRRIVNNLVKEVISAYYRMASLEKVKDQVETAVADGEKAMEALRRVESSRTTPLEQVLEQQRALIGLLGQLRQLSIDLAVARTRLAALMNLPLATDFSLAPMDDNAFVPPVIAMSLEELESLGIYLRPDLREEAYQARIDREEVKKEMLRMLPGITTFSSGNYDHNSYLTNHFWAEAGARATMDILGLASRYKQYQSAKTQVEVSRARRLAATVAAMVQINMSFHQYRQALRAFDDARELNSIDARLLELSSASQQARTAGRLEHIMRETASVTSRLEMDNRMVEILSAWANLYFSIGGDIMSGFDGTEEMQTLVCLSQEALEQWLSGALPSAPGQPSAPRQIASAALPGIAAQPLAFVGPEASVPEISPETFDPESRATVQAVARVIVHPDHAPESGPEGRAPRKTFPRQETTFGLPAENGLRVRF